jgi:hypothetical protein
MTEAYFKQSDLLGSLSNKKRDGYKGLTSEYKSRMLLSHHAKRKYFYI